MIFQTIQAKNVQIIQKSVEKYRVLDAFSESVSRRKRENIFMEHGSGTRGFSGI